jgi:TrmH RNA methyltransferase
MRIAGKYRRRSTLRDAAGAIFPASRGERRGRVRSGRRALTGTEAVTAGCGRLFRDSARRALARERAGTCARVREAASTCHHGPGVTAPHRKPTFKNPPREPREGARGVPRAPQEPRAEPSELVQGLRAGLAVFVHRPGDVLRVLHTRDVLNDVSALGKWAQREGVPFSEGTAAELDRFAASSHHEGLCVVARPRRWAPARELADVLARTRGAIVALDRVRNPYNVGAILRSAAFFGFEGALFGSQAQQPELAPTAIRVAEGGAEQLLLTRTTDLADTLARLRERGVRAIGADGHATTDAIGFAFPRPTVLVLGNEREGLSDRVRAQCDAIVAVRGGGGIESLNVGVAAGVLMAETTRGASRRTPT